MITPLFFPLIPMHSTKSHAMDRASKLGNDSMPPPPLSPSLNTIHDWSPRAMDRASKLAYDSMRASKFASASSLQRPIFVPHHPSVVF